MEMMLNKIVPEVSIHDSLTVFCSVIHNLASALLQIGHVWLFFIYRGSISHTTQIKDGPFLCCESFSEANKYGISCSHSNVLFDNRE